MRRTRLTVVVAFGALLILDGGCAEHPTGDPVTQAMDRARQSADHGRTTVVIIGGGQAGVHIHDPRRLEARRRGRPLSL